MKDIIAWIVFVTFIFYISTHIIAFVLFLIHDYKTADKKKALNKFAKANNLIFTPDYGYPRVYGTYRGYNFALEEKKEVMTIKLIRQTLLSDSEKRQDNQDIMDRFWSYYDIATSERSLEIISEGIIFKSKLIENKDKLQSISDQLVNLIEIYPDVCKIGGEVVDSLLQTRPFKSIIWQIIKAISAETTQQIKPKAPLLLCKKCLAFCSSHKVKAPSLLQFSKAKYYGCRICRQSREFHEGRSMAVLDNQMNEKLSIQENEISVNWLTFRKPFDFHEVRIIQASDREVEEFAMQVGNDMDEFRQPRYKEIPCTIASGCKLTENSLRILKNTFGEVLMK